MTEPASPVESAPSKELVVIARNPQEMQVAQQQLVGWSATKLKQLKDELEDVKQNLAIAKKNKWRHLPYERRTQALAKEIEFYEKVEVAFQAGYVVVPNFDGLDIFAVRTTRRKPTANRITTEARWPSTPRDQESSRPPLGEGEYVNAEAKIVQRKYEVETESGKKDKLDRWATEFREVAFPFTLAKPEVLDHTAQAMVLKCFDDIGVLPARHHRRGDPMVIGRIWKHAQGGYRRKIVSFLITWFVDTRDL